LRPLQLAIAIGLTAVPRVVIMPILSIILMDHEDVGPTKIAAASGLFFAVAQIGGVAGPAVTGALSDRSGDFETAVNMHAAVWGFMILLLVVGLGRVTQTRARTA